MLRQDCSAGVGKATAEHPLGRAWDDRCQCISLARLRAAGAAWDPPSAVPRLRQPRPHQQTCPLRRRLASSWMEKSLRSRFAQPASQSRDAQGLCEQLRSRPGMEVLDGCPLCPERDSGWGAIHHPEGDTSSLGHLCAPVPDAEPSLGLLLQPCPFPFPPLGKAVQSPS